MAHLVLGFPTLRESIDLARTIEHAGASFLELQIPFSDPIADGPTIMEANEVALRAGATPKKCLLAVREIARKSAVPIYVMSYYNLVLNFEGGAKQFCALAKRAGVTGLIIPDLPAEEKNEALWKAAKDAGLVMIPFVSPLTGEARMKKIAKLAPSNGFVYCVATTGTTGARRDLDSELGTYLKRVRKKFKIPLAVGFGISSPVQVTQISAFADIAIVGSATLERMKAPNSAERKRNISKFIASLVGR